MANVTRIEAAHHSSDEVRVIVREAVAIADELDLQGHKWQPVFIQACQLLGQKSVTFIESGPLTALNLPLNHR